MPVEVVFFTTKILYERRYYLMNKITFHQSNCKEETASAWLVSLLKFAYETKYFKDLEGFRLPMIKKRYTIYQKLMTLISSIAVGCESTNDINERLHPEKLAANILGMERFPDQSQISRFLQAMDEESISQLEQIHHEIFIGHSNSLSSDEEIVVDFDQTGLIANGKTYECSSKGYFSKKKNQSGYQASAAFVGKNSETISLFLDTGNTHCQDRIEDLLTATLSKFRDNLLKKKLIIRMDSGYGSMENIEKLKSIPNLLFLTKGYSTRQSANLAKDIKLDQYTKVDDGVWVYEFPSEDGLRVILVQILTKHGKLVYTHLITNIPEARMSAPELFHFYNQRQTIEAFFKMAKNVYGIKNLRTRKFYGIYTFLWLVFLTHNFITNAKALLFEDSPLADTGMKVLVNRIGNIKAIVNRSVNAIKVIIPTFTKLAKQLVYALREPRYVQLSLFDYHKF